MLDGTEACHHRAKVPEIPGKDDVLVGWLMRESASLSLRTDSCVLKSSLTGFLILENEVGAGKVFSF